MGAVGSWAGWARLEVERKSQVEGKGRRDKKGGSGEAGDGSENRRRQKIREQRKRQR